MASATGKAECIRCGKERRVVRCDGCSQAFCYDHIVDHRQELTTQFDEIEVHRDVFRQRLTEQTADPQQHSLIKQIDQWEKDSIQKIQRTAKECKQLLLQHTTEHIEQIETSLSKLTNQLRQTRQENDFNEIDLSHFNEKLTQLAKELDQPPNVSIQQHSTALINKISVVTSSKEQFVSFPHFDLNVKWRQNAISVAGGNGKGNQLNQLRYPVDIYVDDDNQCIYIVDKSNHRIVEWKYDATNGRIVAGGNGEGNRPDQLKNPIAVIVDKRNDSLIICDNGNERVVRWSRRNGTNGQTIISNIMCSRLTMDHNGYLYVSDEEKHEVRRWKIGETTGTLVAGGNGKGNRLNQLDWPTHIFVDQDDSVYVSDFNNHRVMKWLKGAKEGIIVAGGQGEGENLTQLAGPQGVIVDHLGHVYVADMENNRVMRWTKGSKEGCIIVGGNGKGQRPNQFNWPMGLSFDRRGNIYVVDNVNHRVQKFCVDTN